MKKLLALVTSFALILGFIPPLSAEAASQSTVILYTNDVHCAIDDYSKLAAYRADLIAQNYDVVTIDAGDAIQGEVIGTLTQGSAIVDIMNEVGYDYAALGNHEFDYSTETFLDLANNEANYQYLACNFTDLRTDKSVFPGYIIEEINGSKIAFVGIATPETYTKSTTSYFLDGNGNFIYSFCENAFYTTIQNTVNEAIADGADYVIAVGHLGISGITDGWKSTDVIAGTTGIDVFLDAHSHEVIKSAVYKNKNNENVILSSTGTKFANFGVMTIDNNGTISTSLMKPGDVNVNASTAATNAYKAVQNKIDSYNAELEYLYEVLGTSETDLVTYDAQTGVRRVRSGETNMGNFVADAYRTITGTDIAFVNGGGVRADILKGDVSRKSLMDVNPWSNEMCIMEITGQHILNALENGASTYPEENGSFLHVSGMSYEIHTYRESPVLLDDKGIFIGLDENMPGRIQNVKINGVPLDPDKTYTVTSSKYVMLENGPEMFKGAKMIQENNLPTDAEMLIQYFEDSLNGKITATQYGNPEGEGRIQIITTNIPATGDTNYAMLWLSLMALSCLCIINIKKKEEK